MLKTVSETLGSHGDGLLYEATDGQKHKVTPLTLKSMARFEKWLEGRAFKAVNDQKDLLGENFPMAISGVAADIAKGRYAFGGKECSDAFSTIPGMVCVISIMMGVDEIRAKHLLETERDSLAPVINHAMKESLPDLEGKQQTVEQAT